VWKKALGWAARLGGVVVLLAVFTIAAYVSFSQFVRRGVTPVPDVTGLTRSQAEALLADSGLEMEVDDSGERYDDAVEIGRIVQQKPGGRSLVKRGSPVQVSLSLGPEVAEVPDLSGLALSTAQVAVSEAGLTMGRVVSVFRLSGEAGTVVDQSPSAGDTVGYAAPVDLYIGDESHGEIYLMPDLIYRDYEVVRWFFERRGFQLGGVKPEVYEGVAPGTILRQYPLAGHPLRRNDVISLVIATRPGDRTEPDEV
jgi:serine/threonine-protein kinase